MPLMDHHYTMLHQASAIHEQVITARGYQSRTAPAALLALGFSEAQARTAPALAIPLWDVHGKQTGWQIRPDRPRQDQEGKRIKYETPYGGRVSLDVHPSVQPYLGNANVPLWITEGVKKGDALVSQGACTIALMGGVWGFRGTNADGSKGMLHDWAQVALHDRLVYVVFDSDVAIKPEVQKALAALCQFLRRQHARPTLVRWPDAACQTKLGVDDFFAAGHTLNDVLALAQPLATTATPHTPARFETITARTLYAKCLPPQQWIIPDILPAGATLFVGRGKDGKSLLAWNLCLAVATGGKALGTYKVDAGDVLYLALEDGERRAQQRLADQMAHAAMDEAPERLELVLWDAPRLGEGLEAQLGTWLDEYPQARLVVVDILEKVRPRRTHNGSVYADDYAALAPLQRLAQDRNIAVLVVHHSNKTRPEDFRDTASGSMGLIAACDTFWSLQRLAGAADASLRITGRDVDEQDLALRFADGFWSVLGQADDYRLSQTSLKVLDVLETAGKPLTPKQLALELAIPEGTMRKHLKRMHERGEVLNLGDGRYIPRSLSTGGGEREQSDATGATGATGATPATGATLGVDGSLRVAVNGNGCHSGATLLSPSKYNDLGGRVAGVAPVAPLVPNGVTLPTADPDFCPDSPEHIHDWSRLSTAYWCPWCDGERPLEEAH